MAKRKHFLFEEIEEYLRNKVYPSNIAAKDYGSKSNFRRELLKILFQRWTFILQKSYCHQRQQSPNGNNKRCSFWHWEF